jgi:hypothetical protein
MSETALTTLLPAFDELRATLDSGDVLLFAGESRFSRGIKRLTRSHWSHSALVARTRGNGALLLWEATLDTDLPDVATHEVAPGVRLYDLEHWIRHYGGETAIRPLRVERTEEMRAGLLAFYEEARGRPYERNRLELFRAVYDGPLGRNRKEDLSGFFCSELVAEAYQRMGLLPDVPVASEYTPHDFSSERRRPLPLLLGATMGAEVLVCRSRQATSNDSLQVCSGNEGVGS